VLSPLPCPALPLLQGSTALYVFLYAVHYFYFKTRMSGFFQT
jgi:hypothetical protein